MDRFKEYLEEQMDLKRPCTIKFRMLDGAVSVLRCHIVDMSTVSHRDMIETDTGIHIGLDQILEVNDKAPENYC
ncbi:MAG TPA: hypothetical protein VFQ73_01450 [Flavisolibacter sp.]|nr:hypothetical protein [Flavisolibacter sp.]